MKTLYTCGECNWTGTHYEMHSVKDINDRVMVGELMAAGQCPECGSLISVDDQDVTDYTIENCINIAMDRGMLPSRFMLVPSVDGQEHMIAVGVPASMSDEEAQDAASKAIEKFSAADNKGDEVSISDFFSEEGLIAVEQFHCRYSWD